MTITKTIHILCLMRDTLKDKDIMSIGMDEEMIEALQSAIDKLTTHPLSEPLFKELDNSVL